MINYHKEFSKEFNEKIFICNFYRFTNDESGYFPDIENLNYIKNKLIESKEKVYKEGEFYVLNHDKYFYHKIYSYIETANISENIFYINFIKNRQGRFSKVYFTYLYKSEKEKKILYYEIDLDKSFEIKSKISKCISYNIRGFNLEYEGEIKEQKINNFINKKDYDNIKEVILKITNNKIKNVITKII